MWHNWSPALLLAAGLALQATATNAQEAIGKATSVRPQAEGTHSAAPGRFQVVRKSIRKRRSALETPVRRIYDF